MACLLLKGNFLVNYHIISASPNICVSAYSVTAAGSIAVDNSVEVGT